MIDKNEVMTKYIKTCPSFDSYQLYFNYADESENSIHFVTMSDDTIKNYVDGSKLKVYQFALISYKSVSPNAIVFDQSSGSLNMLLNENMEDMAEVRKIIDWVNEQNELHNYPDFGEGYVVEEINCTENDPILAGITTDTTGVPLAKYSIVIRLQYLDTTKMLWNN